MDNIDEVVALTEETAIQYVRTHPALGGLFSQAEPLTCKEIGDGNINMIYAIWSDNDPTRTILIKQALPFIRKYSDESLTVKRMAFEAAYYEHASKLCPEFLPRFYFYDPKFALIVMENLNHHVVLRKGLIEKNFYPHLSQHMGQFLAKILFTTSDFHMSSYDKKEAVRKFINPDMCIITEGAVFTDTYCKGYGGNKWNPLLDAEVFAIREDPELLLNVRELTYNFMTKAQALLHGDLHTGSIMLNQDETRVIDPEFCFFGPMGFDIGALLGNYFLNYSAQEARIVDNELRRRYQEYLISLIRETWLIFVEKFEELWKKENSGIIPFSFVQQFLHSVLQDSAGYAGCKMIRRIIGSAHVEDLDGIPDLQQQAIAMSLGLEIGKKLILERKRIDSIEDFIQIGLISKPSYSVEPS